MSGTHRPATNGSAYFIVVEAEINIETVFPILWYRDMVLMFHASGDYERTVDRRSYT